MQERWCFLHHLFSEGRAALGPVLNGLDVNFPVVNKKVFGAVVF